MTPARHSGWFRFDPADPIYNEHFPGRPVVPGTLIMEAFMTAVEQTGFKVTRLNRFRFKTFVTPGSYPYELLIGPDAIRCRLRHKERDVATGKIFYDR